MNNNPTINLNTLIIGSILSVIIFILGIMGLFAPLENFYVDNTYSFIEAQREKFDWFSKVDLLLDNAQTLREEKRRLGEEVLSLNETILDLELKLDSVEYILQNDILDFDNENELIPAIVLRSELNPDDYFYLNKGTLDGISTGDVVVLGRYLVGTIVETGSNYSKVQSISSDDTLISVVSIDTKAKGVLKGKYSGLLEVKDILSTDNLQVGDIFVTEGSFTKGIPFGLYIGKVREIVTDSTNPTKVARIENELEVGNIYRLFVIKSDE